MSIFGFIDFSYSGFHNGRPQAIETGSVRGHDPYITDVFSHFLSKLAFGVKIFENGCKCYTFCDRTIATPRLIRIISASILLVL